MESVSQEPSTLTTSSGVGLGWLNSGFDLTLAGAFSEPGVPACALVLWLPFGVGCLPSPSSPETDQKPAPTIRETATTAAPTIISWVRFALPPPGAGGRAACMGAVGAPNCGGAPASGAGCCCG